MRFEIVRFALALAILALPLGAALEQRLNFDQVRRMSSAEATTGVSLRVQGVASTLSAWSNPFFLRAKDGGASVDRTNSAEVRAGDLVEVVGKTGAGKFAPILQAYSVNVLSSGNPLPHSLKASYGELSAGSLDSQRVKRRGVVHSATVPSSWGQQVLLLKSDLNGELITARVYDFSKTTFDSWIDSKVRVRGVAGTIFNEKRQFLGIRLFVPSLSDIYVEEKGAIDPFSIAQSPFSGLLQFDLSRRLNHRVHVSGVLIAERGGRTLYLQQGSEGIVVKTDRPVHAELGARLEASGFIHGGEYTPALHDAVVRMREMAPLPDRIRIAASKVIEVKDGFGFAAVSGLLVQMEVTVIDQIDHHDEQVWILHDQDKLFEAHLPIVSGIGKLPGITEGSRPSGRRLLRG